MDKNKDRFPFDIEIAYSKELNKFIDSIEKKFKEIFLGKKNSEDLIDFDDEELKKEFLEYYEELLTTDYAFDMCSDYILDVLEYTIALINSEAKEIVGISFIEQAFYDEKVIQELLEKSISLIKSEPTKYLRTYDSQLQKLISEKIEQGQTLSDLSKAIQATTGIERNRANLIAADQVGNVFAETSKIQFKGIGLKKFIWETSRDARVRKSHAEREGKIYEWDNPPDGEIPGRPIRCRCSAGIVKEELLNL